MKGVVALFLLAATVFGQSLGSNLLVNPSFELINTTTGKPAGWSGDAAFTLDTAAYRTGSRSYRLKDAPSVPYTQVSRQTLTLKKGTYRITGWIEPQNLATIQGSGVRICLQAPPNWPWVVSQCTNAIRGTSGWQLVQRTGITITADTTAAFVLEAYGEPNGTAWFDDVALQSESIDTTPPVISSIAASQITSAGAAISWLTNEPADSQVEYGISTSPYDKLTPISVAVVTRHTVVLDGLLPGTGYHYRVRSKDSSGNLATSPDCTFVTQPAVPIPGGLTAYPQRILLADMLRNGSFEQIDAQRGKPSFWTGDSAFTPDTTVAKNGALSYRLKDANLVPYAQSSAQKLSLTKGIYRLDGWVKTQALGAASSGVRLCLSAPPAFPWTIAHTCTSLANGTADWRQVTAAAVVIPQDTTAAVSLDAYGEPGGTAWFDGVQLRRELQPLDVFLLYPNYRGILFDDQAQTMRFAVAVTPLPGTAMADYVVYGSVTDDESGATIVSTAWPAAAEFTAALDGSRLVFNRAFSVKFTLAKVTGGMGPIEYPAYKVSKLSGAARSTMTVSFDQSNRFLLRNRPAFLLGVYDSGLGYNTDEPSWEQMLGDSRRLWELPINTYLNYWYGEATNAAWIPLLNVLQRHGVYGITNANCFADYPANTAKAWFFTASEAETSARAAHSAWLGLYLADECVANLAPGVLDHHKRAEALDADGLTLATLLPSNQLGLWRDSVDLIATDPYPFFGTEPAQGYPLHKVAEAARRTAEATKGARPFVTVLQFFQGDSLSRWPTQAELRNMSYMAISEGANGLLYWSLGVKGLAWVCTGWCPQKVEYFNRLKAVMLELKALEPALTSVDRPDLLLGNNNGAVRTRVKFVDGKGYLIACNSTNVAATTTFVWGPSAGTVTVYNEGRSVPVSAGAFSDQFGPYQAHVYVVQ